MSGEIRVTYVGHATVLIELDGVRLLTDPVLRGRVAHLRRRSSAPVPAIVEDLDAVLLSHLHHDHLDIPTLRSLEPSTRVIAPKGSAAFLRRAGFTEVTELGPGESTRLGGQRVEVTAIPADHSGRRRPFGGPVAVAIGFEVRGSQGIYFAGDTDLFPAMGDLTGNLDVALLPVWGWGPKLGPGHMDPDVAARAAAILRPRIAIPIHWGTFLPFGLRRHRSELLKGPPRRFAAQVSRLAPEVEVRILEPGETTDLAAQ